MHLGFTLMRQQSEQRYELGRGGGGDPPFSPSTFPPHHKQCFGGMEEVETFQAPGEPVLMEDICSIAKASQWPWLHPSCAQVEVLKGWGMVRAVRSYFHFTCENINAQKIGWSRTQTNSMILLSRVFTICLVMLVHLHCLSDTISISVYMEWAELRSLFCRWEN